MQFECPECKAILSSDAVHEGMMVPCPECGAEIECHPHVATPQPTIVDGVAAILDENSDIPDAIHAKVASAIGIEKLKRFNLAELLTEVFSWHKREEVESIYSIGTAKTTPDILEVNAAWPKPWIFTRLMATSLILYVLLLVGWKMLGNTKLIPGLMLVGSFAIPLSTLILFFELNVRRNVSMYMVLRLAFVGGIASILVTHLMPILNGLVGLVFMYTLPNGAGFLGGSFAGPAEETAKVLAMVIFASTVKYRYKLNGLLIGAAVGMGFAAFESAGYAFDVLFEERSVAPMVEVINSRGLLSPFCHIVWSAIAGCALWRVAEGRKFNWRMLCEVRFIRLLLVPVVLHMIWNCPIELPYLAKYLILGVVGWLVCLSLVQEGLREIAAEQKRAQSAAGAGGGAGTDGACPSCGERSLPTAMPARPESHPNCLQCYLWMFMRYFGFRGRSTRSEFWLATTIHMIANIVLALFGFVALANDGLEYLPWFLYALVSTIPWLALHVRRLHDTNKRGWWVLLAMMPVLNLAYMVWMATDGDHGRNRFGINPKMKG